MLLTLVTLAAGTWSVNICGRAEWASGDSLPPPQPVFSQHADPLDPAVFVFLNLEIHAFIRITLNDLN